MFLLNYSCKNTRFFRSKLRAKENVRLITPSKRVAPFGKKHPSLPSRNFTYLRSRAMIEMHLTAIMCISCSLVCWRNSLLVFNAILWYYLFLSYVCIRPALCLRGSLAVSPASCSCAFLLLHTVRMTWRSFPCFLTRGLSREYLLKNDT
jgi:hypothetical protein